MNSLGFQKKELATLPHGISWILNIKRVRKIIFQMSTKVKKIWVIRGKFILKWFSTKLNNYRQIHIKDNVAEQMKKSRLIGMYHEIKNEINERIRVYHVDIHKNFCPCHLSYQSTFPSHNKGQHAVEPVVILWS